MTEPYHHKPKESEPKQKSDLRFVIGFLGQGKAVKPPEQQYAGSGYGTVRGRSWRIGPDGQEIIMHDGKGNRMYGN